MPPAAHQWPLKAATVGRGKQQTLRSWGFEPGTKEAKAQAPWFTKGSTFVKMFETTHKPWEPCLGTLGTSGNGSLTNQTAIWSAGTQASTRFYPNHWNMWPPNSYRPSMANAPFITTTSPAWPWVDWCPSAVWTAPRWSNCPNSGDPCRWTNSDLALRSNWWMGREAWGEYHDFMDWQTIECLDG